jgi:DNA-binding transcriptional LysR family regulator
MNIRQLQYFLAVAHELSFTKAAERVHIAQPPLSQQIIALEEELGTPLFTREKRKIQLTAAGAILVEHAQRVLNATAAAVSAVRASQRGAQASISVGAIYSALYSFLPATLRIFTTLAPNTDVSLQEMTIGQQVEALKEGEIEVAILRGQVSDRDIATELLYRELLVVAVPSDSKFDNDEPVELVELATWPLIAVALGPTRGYADRIFDIFENRDLKPNIVNEVKDMHTSVCLVAAGMGVSIVPAIMQIMQPRGVVYRPLKIDNPGVSCVVAWRKNGVTPAVEAFLEAARRNAAAMKKEHPEIFLQRDDH